VKKTTAHGRRMKRDKATEGKRKAESDFQSQLTTTRLRLHLMEDGEDATELLAALAVVIGTPCEAAARCGIREPWVRQLHGTLKTITSLCLEGYKWRTEYTQALDRAIEISEESGGGLPIKEFAAAWADATGFAALILAHQVDQGAIA
jgi:hypothetical protein